LHQSALIMENLFVVILINVFTVSVYSWSNFGLLTSLLFIIRYNVKIRKLNYILSKKSERLIEQYKLIETQKNILEEYTYRLENENTIAHFETLKNQLDPHMLFNALAVLKQVIDRDKVEAKEFINDLSHVLRYALQLKSNILVKLEEELSFVMSYINIITKRYHNCFNVYVDIPDFIRDYYIPPFSLQLIVENVVKHNVLNEQEPIDIKIYYKDDAIHVVNSKTRKTSMKTISVGVGHQNLINRYKLVSVREPVFISDEQFFSVTLPLIKEE
jgi:LytS/YehU family sensor histidine kinase